MLRLISTLAALGRELQELFRFHRTCRTQVLGHYSLGILYKDQSAGCRYGPGSAAAASRMRRKQEVDQFPCEPIDARARHSCGHNPVAIPLTSCCQSGPEGGPSSFIKEQNSRFPI